MKYTFHPHAEKELKEIESHYDDIDEELGNRFRADMEIALSRIVKFPYGWQPVSRVDRRCRLSSFPYGIIYRLVSNTIYVIAVAHMQRKIYRT